MTKNKDLYLPVKRALDVMLSLTALVLLSPILILVSIIIKIDSKGPIIFKQRRIGINNSQFNIYKFRTMRNDAPNAAPTDQFSNASSWITRSGAILRKTSIDELPQLVNILKGEMSIVGPRPALWNQYNLIELRTRAGVDSIKPGLTGWAQINGRDENNDEEKAYWDREYTQKYSLTFDLKCILLTAISISKKDGVIEGGNSQKKNSN